MIDVTRLTKTYWLPHRVDALVDVSLSIAAGEVVVVIGPSGSGKSTLLRCLNRLETADSGHVFIDGIDVLDPKTNINRVRAEVGMVFQSFNLLPTLNVLENVCLPALLAQKPAEKTRARALELLEWLGLAPRLAHMPAQLSGGEMQRTAIARALINDPALILADEPTGNLDSRNGRIVIDLLAQLNRQSGRTVVVATHSDLADDLATVRLRLRDGAIADSPCHG